jgi:hypothetical protein
MEVDKIYHLIVDAYDGTTFGLASNSFTYRVSDPVADVYCGEYRNVPILKNLGIMFELVSGVLVRLNL